MKSAARTPTKSLRQGLAFLAEWVTTDHWLSQSGISFGLIGLGMGLAVVAIGPPGLLGFSIALAMLGYSSRQARMATADLRWRNDQLQVANAQRRQRVTELLATTVHHTRLSYHESEQSSLSVVRAFIEGLHRDEGDGEARLSRPVESGGGVAERVSGRL